MFDGTPAAVDLLLTDVVMPEMHGPELAERLATSRPNLPVMFVSGYSDRMPVTATVVVARGRSCRNRSPRRTSLRPSKAC